MRLAPGSRPRVLPTVAGPGRSRPAFPPEPRPSSMEPERLSRELREATSPHLDRRRRIAGLLLGASGSMALISAYYLGLLRHTPKSPLPWLDADRVDASKEAYARLERPDAVLGLGSYALTLGVAAAGAPTGRGRAARACDVVAGRPRGRAARPLRADADAAGATSTDGERVPRADSESAAPAAGHARAQLREQDARGGAPRRRRVRRDARGILPARVSLRLGGWKRGGRPLTRRTACTTRR